MPNASLTIDGTEVIKKENGVVSLKNTNADTSLSFPANHAGIKTALNASGDAPIYACRAWVNFNGTDAFSPNPSISAIRDSGNVTSIYENAAGNYQINFETSMPHSNYAVAAFGSNEAITNITLPTFGGPQGISPAGVARSTYQQTGSVRVYFTEPNSYTGGIDKETATVAIFC